ncbi:hypothetical protein BT63DRAFT_438398 [Microthyrium microscopicum]|uniref:F-box domain-containing protein n=1 Tax=Microthyrium microscopicum TaxID=703497 RepID=A0A6A6UH93_9PEZI|nr:hypothetical protein BT63DRAFT_438398 [Microthyrium microscopicum]
MSSHPQITKEFTQSLFVHGNVNEKLSPFYFLVSRYGCPNVSAFSFFMSLPIELRMTVYEKCEPATLWTLMRTSSQIRSESQTFFWAHKEPWYLLDIPFSLQHTQARYHQLICPDFAARVEKVEIPAKIPADHLWNPILGILRLQYSECNGTMKDSWRIFQTYFPKAKRVLITLRTRWDDEILESLDTFVKQTPPGIELLVSSIAYDSSESRKRRQLWKRSSGQDHLQWKSVDDHWQAHSIFMPCRTLDGIAGRFVRHCYYHECYHIERDSWKVLARDMVMKRYLAPGSEGQSLTCPREGCVAELKNEREWIEHFSWSFDETHSAPKYEDYATLLPEAEYQPFLRLLNTAENDPKMCCQNIFDPHEYGFETWKRCMRDFFTNVWDDPPLHVGQGLNSGTLFRAFRCYVRALYLDDDLRPNSILMPCKKLRGIAGAFIKHNYYAFYHDLELADSPLRSIKYVRVGRFSPIMSEDEWYNYLFHDVNVTLYGWFGHEKLASLLPEPRTITQGRTEFLKYLLEDPYYCEGRNDLKYSLYGAFREVAQGIYH